MTRIIVRNHERKKQKGMVNKIKFYLRGVLMYVIGVRVRTVTQPDGTNIFEIHLPKWMCRVFPDAPEKLARGLRDDGLDAGTRYE